MTEEAGHILTNKPVPNDISDEIKKLTDNERLLFTIVGDLSKNSKYSQSVLAVTDEAMICFDETYENKKCL